ncbi:protein angel homolog 2 isoform X2 [Lampris incognitus]|nr:protein angel homolog 2 isoform X2 [Lampris incognitus]
MFLHLLSTFGSSFLPQSHSALLRASFRSSATCHPLLFASHPRWLLRGFPPWPPYHLPSPDISCPRRTCRGSLLKTRLQNLPFGNNLTDNSVLSWRSPLPGFWFKGSEARMLHTSACLMQHLGNHRGPPHKKRKHTEENKSAGDRGEDKGGGLEGTVVTSEEARPGREHLNRSGGQGNNKKSTIGEGSRSQSGEKVRVGYGEKDRHHHPGIKDSVGQDGALGRARATPTQTGFKDSHPTGPRTQSPQPKHPEQVPCLKPAPKSSPCLKGGSKDVVRGEEEQGGHGGGRGGPWGKRNQTSKGDHKRDPSPQPPNPWTTASAERQPLPPGIVPPCRQLNCVKPVRPLQRQWEVFPTCSTGLQPAGRSAAFDFTVLSYNILSQELLQDNAYLYRHCDSRVLPWAYRLPNLLAEIQNYNADILCLQEVQADHFETQLKPVLQALGYQCEYKKRTGRKPDGCAIIFKTSCFSLLSSHAVEYVRPGDPLLDRDNVGLVLLLRPNHASGQWDPSSSVCIANTHLLYNPRRGDIKLAQLAILLAEISQRSRLPDGSSHPVVVCGDFNSTPWSPLYSFLTTGCLEYEGLPIGRVSGQEDNPRGQRPLMAPIWSKSVGVSQQCQYYNKPTMDPGAVSSTGVTGAISSLTVQDLTAKAPAASNRARIEHSVRLQSSYQHFLVQDGRPEITTCHSRTAVTVDYILYTPDSSASSSHPGGRGLQLLSRLSLVGQSELEEVNCLPNQHHSSDHLPLLARFRLRC